MIELRTDIKIRDLKPSMKDLDRLDDVVPQEGLVAAAKADGESRQVVREEDNITYPLPRPPVQPGGL